MRTRLWLWKDYWTRTWPEKMLTAFVWRLPRRIVYWCVVRAAVTTKPIEYPAEATAREMLGALSDEGAP